MMTVIIILAIIALFAAAVLTRRMAFLVVAAILAVLLVAISIIGGCGDDQRDSRETPTTIAPAPPLTNEPPTDGVETPANCKQADPEGVPIQVQGCNP